MELKSQRPNSEGQRGPLDNELFFARCDIQRFGSKASVTMTPFRLREQLVDVLRTNYTTSFGWSNLNAAPAQASSRLSEVCIPPGLKFSLQVHPHGQTSSWGGRSQTVRLLLFTQVSLRV